MFIVAKGKLVAVPKTKKQKIRTKIQILIWGTGAVLLASYISGPTAKADGYNPNLMRDAAVMCAAASIPDMVAVYGLEYTWTTMNAVCPDKIRR